MKKLILLVICFCGILFSQSNYEADLVIEDLYWHNHNEWAAHLRGDLYLNGVLQQPSSSYYYSWQWYFNDQWTERITSGYGVYTHFVDGNENQIFQFRLQISGPGFSDMSGQVSVGKYGEIKTVYIDAFKENGSSANSDVKIKYWATYKWREIFPGGPFYFSQEDDNFLKDSILSIEQFGQRFNWWDTDVGDEYFRNHESIFVSEDMEQIDVHHKTFHDATLNSVIDGYQLGKTLFKDPWLVDETDPVYNDPPYGYRNLGMSAPFEEVENGINNIGINTIYKGVFLNQGAD